MITSSVCIWMCTLNGLLMSAGQRQVKELSCCGHAKPKLMVLSKTSAKIYWVADIMSQGQQLRVAAVGCFQYCSVYLQWCRDYMLVSVNKTAALFSTEIGPGICWFPWWQQVFDLYDYFSLFIWPTNDQNPPALCSSCWDNTKMTLSLHLYCMLLMPQLWVSFLRTAICKTVVNT